MHLLKIIKKILAIILIMTFFAFPLYATVAVSGVILDQSDLTLNIGDSYNLAATVTPSDATNRNVTWSSNNEAVATVDEDGVVTGIAAGTATITVTTEEGGFTARCNIEVTEADEIEETHEEEEESETGEEAEEDINEKGLNPEQEESEVLTDEEITEEIIEEKIKQEDAVKKPLSLLKGKSTYTADRFIIKYKNETEQKKKLQYQELLKDKLSGVKEINARKGQTHEVVILDRKMKAKEFIEALDIKGQGADIEYIQPDYQLSLLSDDPYFSSQWGLKNNQSENVQNYNIPMFQRLHRIPPHLREFLVRHPDFMELIMNTPPEELRDRLMRGDIPDAISDEIPHHIFFELAHEPLFWESVDNTPKQQAYACDAGVVGAWEKSLGEGVIVAVIDTGIDIYHEDLAENIWTNTGEIPGNGSDDDGNGFADDFNGWNFCDNNNMVFNGMSVSEYVYGRKGVTDEVYGSQNTEEEKHGTHIAGIIAGVKDNEKGIAGTAPKAKIMPLKVFKNGTAYTSNIIAAIEYAESMGAKIVNCSWGSAMDNPALKDAVENSGMLFVCAAGNSGADIDESPVYPASFDCDNIISVASVNRNGLLSAFSNYGAVSVHVAAPGEDIFSTAPENGYESMNGTSMAAGFVSGEAALLLGMDGSLSPFGVRERIMKYSDRLSSLTCKVLSENKVNFRNTVYELYNDELIIVEGDSGGGTASLTLPGSGDFVLFDVPPTGLLNIIQVAGGNHSLALKEDGTVWAWGRNSFGQLGDGTTNQRGIPLQVNGLTGIKAIEGGYNHSLALKEDGTVWAWGHNNCGQLGDGTITQRTSPVQVTGLTGVKAIAGGGNHSLALKEDGTVWAWGWNAYGQLGDGTTTTRTSPVQVTGLTGVKAIAVGTSHSLALKEDGTAWAWGWNWYSQLGDGTTTTRTSPVQVTGLTGIKAIEGGYNHSLALKEDGTVWAWGWNAYGQLGDGTKTQRTTPVQVTGLTDVKAITGGYYHSLALKEDGTVWAWGYNYYGQLGDGTITQRITPVQVSGLMGVKVIASGDSHNFALKEDGMVWAWGDNYYSQLGDGTMIERTSPVQVTGLTGVKTIAGGQAHSLALKEDGTVWAWGENCYGQLGDGTTTTRTSPVQVTGLTGVKAIADGIFYCLAVKEDGTVWAWGENSGGQLGDGTTTNRTSPVYVNGLTEVKTVAAGGGHSLAVKEDGTVWAWGYNNCGQLGDGTTTNRTSPVQVTGLTGVKAIAGGGSHSLALKEDGTVWAWGYNNYGQLGDGTTTNRTTPVQVSGLTGVTSVAGRNMHSLAVKEDGTAWAWGWNAYGQLGDGTTTNRTTPVQVTGLTDAIAIAAGTLHSLTLKEDGTAWAWGWNGSGQLGDGTTIQRTTPVQVSGLTGGIAIASGGGELSYHSLALIEDGTVWAWGSDWQGELGIGRTLYSTYPMGIYGTPPFVVASITDTELTLSYSIIGGTINYEIEIDGSSINNGKNMTYIYPIATPGYLPTYRVRSINESGPGLWSVNAPSAGSFGTITAGSIQATWEANGNPAGTLYKIAAFDEDDVLLAENNWTDSLSDIIAELSANTLYIIKIKAKNEEGVESVWHEIGMATTILAVPVTAVALNKTSTSITVGAIETLEATVSPEDATNKAVTWSSSNENIATVDESGEVTGIAAGTATITVTTEDGEYVATCEVTVIDEAVPVTAVALNKTSTIITVGATETLEATVSPEDATNKTVTWSSSNENIATVDETGEVTGIAAGTATITVTTEDGEYVATCEVTVIDEAVPVTAVALNKTSTIITVGATETLEATVSPEDATNKTVTWSSSNENIATVDETGEVTGIAAGTATITVTTEDGEYVATCEVTVIDEAVPVTAVALNKTSTIITVGATETLEATVSPEDATNKTVTWSSSNENIATVDESGEVTGIAAGTATITVTTEDGGYTATCEVTVIDEAIPVTGVSLNKTSTSITVGAIETLEATVSPEDATNKTVTWSSSNENIATVDESGEVTGIAAGTATITVTTADRGYTDICTVTVTTIAVSGVSLNKTDMTIGLGATETLVATITPTDATNQEATWSSDNEIVATVDTAGVVTGISIGTATITVTTADGGFTSTCTVEVRKPLYIYIYDNQNRLDYIELPTGENLDFQYDDNGSLIGITYSQ